MNQPIRIAIIGDFIPTYRAHTMTDAALTHAASALDIPIVSTWLPTPLFDDPSDTLQLQEFDALWCSAGSPYASMQGALNAIHFAREQGKPFFAT